MLGARLVWRQTIHGEGHDRVRQRKMRRAGRKPLAVIGDVYLWYRLTDNQKKQQSQHGCEARNKSNGRPLSPKLQPLSVTRRTSTTGTLHTLLILRR